jgi:hypothetical protein
VTHRWLLPATLTLTLAATAHGAPAPSASLDQADGAEETGGVRQRTLGGPDLEEWLDGQPKEPPLLPHLYGKVRLQGAPRLSRLPTAAEVKQIDAVVEAGKGAFPRVVKQRLEGVFLVALDREEEKDGRRYYRTTDGRYLRFEDVKLVEPPRMHGELLGKGLGLPLAFVYGEDRPVYRWAGGELVDELVARKHSRFHVRRIFRHRGLRYAEGPGGIVLPADALRVARVVQRPDDIPAGQKWIHVDLSEQALVAYEGDRPVFATLVSSGRKGYEPPTGVYRVRTKYLETTMDGPDPSEGWYEVQQVPWTMYYHLGFALHGAYWHDTFGQVRSHGCTNIAPADARWLFLWSDPKLPEGWTSRKKSGTYVYFTE